MASNYSTYKLGEVIDKVAIASKVKQKEYLADGKFPIIDQGQNMIGGYTNDEKLLVNAELPVIVFGDHTKVKKYINFPFVAGADGTKIIKPKKEFFSEPKLFYYFLHCLKFPDKGYARHFQYLLKSDISVPPLATQRAIVTRIESLFAELDKGVEKLKTAQQQLKVYRQAVLNDCLTKGSEKWKNVKLGEVTLKIGSGSTPKGGQTSYKVSGIPLVRSMNIYSDFIKYDGLAFIDESQAKLLDNVRVQEGDILLNITGASIGRVNIAPKEWNGARVNQHVCIIRMNSEYNSKFVQKYLASPMIQHWISTENYGETRQALSKTMIENIEIPNPPLLTQQRIVQEIETRLSACDEVEKNIAESLQQAEALRQSILKKAFSGELV